MRRRYGVLLILIMLCIILVVPGCKKKPPMIASGPQPTADRTEPPPPATPAPSASLSASPSTIDRGEQTTLSWSSNHASSIVIDGGVGNVEESGSIVISPTESTTYTLVARGPGGEGRSSARVTVLEPRPPVDVSTDADFLQRLIDEGKVRPVFFEYDKADLTAESQAILSENARMFRSYPKARVTIEGHCDERGTEEYNLALGDRRANAARDYLLQLGVDGGQLEPISYGEERPFAPGHDEASWALNRRAHFSVKR